MERKLIAKKNEWVVITHFGIIDYRAHGGAFSLDKPYQLSQDLYETGKSGLSVVSDNNGSPNGWANYWEDERFDRLGLKFKKVDGPKTKEEILYEVINDVNLQLRDSYLTQGNYTKDYLIPNLIKELEERGLEIKFKV